MGKKPISTVTNTFAQLVHIHKTLLSHSIQTEDMTGYNGNKIKKVTVGLTCIAFFCQRRPQTTAQLTSIPFSVQ